MYAEKNNILLQAIRKGEMSKMLKRGDVVRIDQKTSAQQRRDIPHLITITYRSKNNETERLNPRVSLSHCWR